MNVFNKVTLQNMKKSRTRTLVTIIGVILSTAMITGVATFALSLQSYMVKESMVRYGNWHLEVFDVDAAFAEKLAKDPEVAAVVPFENVGYATLEGGKNPDKPYLFMAGFDTKAFDTFPIKITAGRLPKNSSEVLVPSHVAANGGVTYAVGDTLFLDLGTRQMGDHSLGQDQPYAAEEALQPDQRKIYTVVGTFVRPIFEKRAAPGYTLITRKESVDKSGSCSLFVTLKHPRKAKSFAKALVGKPGYMLNDNLLRFMGASDDTVFNVFLYSVGSILVLLIMIGSIFLIYNSFVISLNERTRQFGILASVGATPKQLRYSVLFEGVCIGAIGIPIGVLAGLTSIRLVIQLVAQNFTTITSSEVPLTMTISLPILAAAVGVSLITILISAYLPARKAAKTPIMVNIRQTNEIKIESKQVKTAPLAAQIYGFEGMLALKNFKRNKKRYRSIVFSLALSVVLFVSARTFGAHLKQAAERSAVDTDYDIVFTTSDMEEQLLFQLYDRFKTVEGVTNSSYQTIAAYSTNVDAETLSADYRKTAGIKASSAPIQLPVEIQFIEDREYQRFIESLNLPLKKYTGPNAKMVAAAKSKDQKHPQGKRVDLFTQSTQRFSIVPQREGTAVGPEQTIDVTFIDKIPIDTLPSQSGAAVNPFVFIVVAPFQWKEQLVPSGTQLNQGLTFSSKNPAQSVKAMEQILKEASVNTTYTFYNVNELFEQNRNILFVVDVFTYVFVVMISLIAIANVFNTISTNIRLRRRELAMLRSVGMTDRDFNKMMVFECSFYGVRALLIGVPASSIISWLIYKGIFIDGSNIVFIFPWVSLSISIVSVFLIVLITMLYAVSKINKENIIDALRDDMI
ncbi:ABC transporter permease [Enterococcus florum]|uniref:ABC transporter permease n=1 Tax=Enterococcus florum TaxID=2480627 RepID=A0A4P5P9Q8_9ENTE|nr:ABC transporter permease [Enterococcus florum]GCF93064.1 ABC transporter permease [Enterococcus florum]